jgi:hypothetical protein
MRNKAIVIFSFVLLLMFSGMIFCDIPTEERAALIALYENTDGDNWLDKSGWKGNNNEADGFSQFGSEGEWKGITVVDGHVTKIDLKDNELEGDIPAELGNLENLEYLDLRDNQLTGSIPLQLGNLQNLTYLNLHSNQLTEIPSELGNLSSLTELYLNNNQFECNIPTELGNLSSLTVLDLNSSQLTGIIPTNFENLASLEKLYLNDNKLSGGIPAELGSLSTNLQELKLNGNKLTGSIPEGLGNLLNLTKLYLQSNNLKGTIPTNLQNLTGLSETDIGYNALYTKNTELIEFLDTKDTDWKDTQTVAPEGVSAIPVDSTSVEVSWERITYTVDPGGYRVFHSTTSGQSYELFDTIDDKNVDQMKVTGLIENIKYYFVVQTWTDPHPNNNNKVESDLSGEESATPGEKVSISGKVTWLEDGLSGVTLTFIDNEGGEPETETTDSEGNYSHEVNWGWTGNVTPEKYGFTFIPASIPYDEKETSNKTDQDYEATADKPIISGRVATEALEGVKGVTMTFSNNEESRTTTTDSDGKYSLGVTNEWTGTVTPTDTKNCCDFVPPYEPYNNVTENQSKNYTATRKQFVISGTVTYEGDPLPEVILTFSDAGESVTTYPDGTYSKEVLCGWSGTVNLEKTGYEFEPVGHTGEYPEVTSNQTDQDYKATAVMPIISGRVATSEGTGLSGVNMTFLDKKGGESTSTITKSDGSYEHRVLHDWSGTVTPDKYGFIFDPLNHSYDHVTSDQSQDYTATEHLPIISGRVATGADEAVEGVTMTFSNGGESRTTTTDSEGFYSLGVPYGWSGDVTPKKDGYTFYREYKPYINVQSNISGQDYTATLKTVVISGTVKKSDGTRLPGVTMEFVSDSGGTETVQTNNNGYYEHPLPYKWSGKVTAQKTGYDIKPYGHDGIYEDLTSDKTGQDYTATPKNVFISGTVKKSDGTELPEVTMEFVSDSGGTETVPTDNNGYYKHPVPYGWSGIVTAQKTGYDIKPDGHTGEYEDVTSDKTGQDYTATPKTVFISGTVKKSDGTVLPGVTMEFVSDSGGTETETTDNNGYYEHTVPYGWSGNVTANKTGYDIKPVGHNGIYKDLNSDKTNQDYEATAITQVIFISGRVITAAGMGVEDVEMIFSNGVKSTFTDSEGDYRQEVPYGWSGTVEPKKTGYEFEPVGHTGEYENVISDQTKQDYEATAIYPKISGTVEKSDGKGLLGVKMTFSSSIFGTETETTDNKGNYEHEVEKGWSGKVTPSKAGYTFVPSNSNPTYYNNVESDLTNQDFTAYTIRTFLISGKVTIEIEDTETGLPGVILNFYNDEGSTFTVTDSNGKYEHFVDEGWSGSVTLSKDGYTFDPFQKEYPNVTSDETQDYTAKEVDLEISGRVFDSKGVGIYNVKLTFSKSGSGESQTKFTDFNGNYQKKVGHKWSGTVSAEKNGYKFEPLGHIGEYKDVASNKLNQDYEAAAISPVISGKVTNPDNFGISGVTLTFSDDGGTAKTDANGNYHHAVDKEWSGTVTAEKTGYDIKPDGHDGEYVNVTSDYIDQNYTASVEANFPVISGEVTWEGKKLPGVKLEFAGSDEAPPYKYTYTNDNGNYSHAVPREWSGTVIPSKNRYDIDPVGDAGEYENVISDKPNEDYKATALPLFISGRVTLETGPGVQDVILTFSDKGGSAATNNEGNYIHTVKPGWYGRVTPTKQGYEFNPPSKDYNKVYSDQIDKNYTTPGIPRLIKGRVTKSKKGSGAVGLEGVKFTLSNKPNYAPTPTDSEGIYQIEVPEGWSGTVTPNMSKHIFIPSHYDYDKVRSEQTDQNYQAIEGFIKLNLKAKWKKEGTLVIRHYYGLITLTIEKTGDITVSSYKICREKADGSFEDIKTFEVSDSLNEYTHEDKLPDKNKSYTYKAKAIDLTGKVIKESDKVTIKYEK